MPTTKRSRKAARSRATLTRVRKTARRLSSIYGLLLQAHEQLRSRVLELEGRAWANEREVGRELEREQAELLDHASREAFRC